MEITVGHFAWHGMEQHFGRYFRSTDHNCQEPLHSIITVTTNKNGKILYQKANAT